LELKQKIRNKTVRNPNLNYYILKNQNQFPNFHHPYNKPSQNQLSQQFNSKPSYSNVLKQADNNNNNNKELFNSDECMEILNEFISRLSDCKTKIDQIKVIADITFKFVYNG
jgi:hypothetical protein